MKVINSNKTVHFDVDDTLILWDYDSTHPDLKTVQIECFDGETRTFQIHERHIQKMEKYRAIGKTIVVWSQSSYDWAERVVLALDIQHLVDYCMRKPEFVVDDLQANNYIETLYFKPEPKDENPI